MEPLDASQVISTFEKVALILEQQSQQIAFLMEVVKVLVERESHQ